MRAIPRRAFWQTRASSLAIVLGLAAFAFAIRLYRLAGSPLRWDEGWSLAQASLPWFQLVDIARQEWHPPLYAALLKLWLVTGKDAWSIRYLSVFLSTLAVPLAYQVAKAWSGRQRLAILAAGLVSVWPLLVQYGQMARMYALAELFTLAAAWFLLRRDHSTRSRWNDLGAVLSTAAALYTFYYTGFALAGIWLYALISSSRQFRRLLLDGALVAITYVPWLLFAAADLQARLGASTGTEGSTILGALRYIFPALQGLTFDLDTGRHVTLAVGIVLLGAPILAPPHKSETKELLLPLLVVGLGVLGVAYGAQTSYWLAMRHLVPIAPFFILALAWALDRLAQVGLVFLALALLALSAAYWPISTRLVYEKFQEVTSPFDPSADYRYLTAQVGPKDLIYFNTLAHAGWYEALRGPLAPRWALALRWNPIVEPMEQIIPRVLSASQTYRSLWFALHEGNSGTNGPLVGWLDTNLYPAAGGWEGDTLYMAYVAPRGPWAGSQLDTHFEHGIRLVNARWTTQTSAGGACSVELTWAADSPVAGDYKVFVHAVDATGQMVTQHDAVPGMGLRPANTWQLGEAVLDRHGLLLPSGQADAQELDLLVGLYDTQTGERVRLPDGRDSFEIGACRVVAP